MSLNGLKKSVSHSNIVLQQHNSISLTQKTKHKQRKLTPLNPNLYRVNNNNKPITTTSNNIVNPSQTPQPLLTPIKTNLNNSHPKTPPMLPLNNPPPPSPPPSIFNISELNQCIYCLSTAKDPTSLPCKHLICKKCLEEISIFSVFSTMNAPQCPKCKANIPNTFVSQVSSSSLAHPPTVPQSQELNDQTEKCSLCNNYNILYECLNCDYLLCSTCKIKHISQPSHQQHKCVSYIANTTDTTQCSIHKINYEYFCITDNVAICTKCYTLLHNEHFVKHLQKENEFFTAQMQSTLAKAALSADKLHSLLLKVKNIQKQLQDEQKHFITKATKYIDNIIQLLLRHKTFIINQITDFYSMKQLSLKQRYKLYKSILNRFNYFKHCAYTKPSYQTTSQQINLMKLISNIEWYNNTILNNIPITNITDKLQLMSYKQHSFFINNPITKLSHLIKDFTFFPLSSTALEPLKRLFSSSNIITPNMINANMLVVLPKIKTGQLLYKVSQDGPSAELFHKKCIDKGPTLILVKTDTHIFGGFNEIGFTNENKYKTANGNFLFSLSDGHVRTPMRCKLIQQMKEFAIWNCEDGYSPGFGVINKADLFIAFKQLDQSYSKLGNVYKCPKGYNPSTFLAGKEKGWNIQDVEVYALECYNEKEFYMMDM